MKVCSLASSSKGNCTLVYNDTQILVVDMGITYKDFEQKIARLNLDIANVVGVIVSHEHSDHTKGVSTLLKKLNTKVYCHNETAEGLLEKTKIVNSQMVEFGDLAFYVGDFLIESFQVCHDVFCVGFNIYENDKKISIVTDLGHTTNNIVEKLYNSRLVILEANHDENMLRTGPYPARLKARILSKHGHLSNTCSAKVVANLAQNNVKQVVFGHLSEENNRGELVLETVSSYLCSVGIEPNVNIKLDIAKPNGIGPIFVIN